MGVCSSSSRMHEELELPQERGGGRSAQRKRRRRHRSRRSRTSPLQPQYASSTLRRRRTHRSKHPTSETQQETFDTPREKSLRNHDNIHEPEADLPRVSTHVAQAKEPSTPPPERNYHGSEPETKSASPSLSPRQLVLQKRKPSAEVPPSASEQIFDLWNVRIEKTVPGDAKTGTPSIRCVSTMKHDESGHLLTSRRRIFVDDKVVYVGGINEPVPEKLLHSMAEITEGRECIILRMEKKGYLERLNTPAQLCFL
ncbi:MAG: hypothetical protein MHM6MM_002969 [Cercozoa sp. M6MM]